MKIQHGNFYKRRDGKVVGPVKKTNDIVWPFWIPEDNYRPYRADGGYNLTGWRESEFDLIEEV